MTVAKRSPAMRFVADIIPAQPDYFVLTLGSEDTPRVVQAPVIAWALERGSFQPYPITLAGIDTSMPYILQPAGTVERCGTQTYRSVRDWYDDKTKAR
jgi:hypothetical protein